MAKMRGVSPEILFVLLLIQQFASNQTHGWSVKNAKRVVSGFYFLV